MKKLIGLIACVMLLGLSSVFAQSKTVTGTVVDQAGLGLPGVSVAVKGTNEGAYTDIDGKWKLTVTSKDVLVVSFVGMKTQEITVGKKTVINVTLEEDRVAVEEVMVVGYGTTTREAKTGAVSVVSAADLSVETADTPGKMLEGKVAGVQINTVSGTPGGETKIRIRGISSINAGNQPLFVIDGVPVVQGDYNYVGVGDVMSSINPSNIESMTVLKDASSASIYGSRAANGVILITTKSGKEGKTKYGLTVNQGWSKKTNDTDFGFMNAKESLDYWRTATINAGDDPDVNYPESLLDGPLTDWWDEVFRTGRTQNYELTASGATEKVKFYTSGSYYKQEGFVIGSDLERINFRTNLDVKLNEKLNFATKLSLSRTEQNTQPVDLAYASPFWGASSILPWHNARNADGSFNTSIPSNGDVNPVQNVALNERKEEGYKVLGTAILDYEIVKGLKIKTQNSIDFLSSNGRLYYHPETKDGAGDNGKLYVGNTRVITLTSSNTLNYIKTFDEVHNINVLAGYEYQANEWSRWDAEGKGLGADIPYLSNVSKDKDVDRSLQEWAMISYFGRLDYNYDGKYYVTGSLRSDGSSRFGENNRFGTFWAVGMSWNIHKEDFLGGMDFINMLKLRASYGTNGNDNIGAYDAYGVYSSRLYNGQGGLAPSQLANPDLTWERNVTYNVGLDFALFNRINGTIEYYNRKTTDMLLDMPLSRTTGFSSLRQNIGELENRGIEINIDGDVIQTDDLTLNLGFNIAFNETELLDLGGETEVGDGFWRRHRLGGGFSDYYVFDWAGVNPDNGAGQWYDKNGNLTEDQTEARRVFKGQIAPDYQGGFSTSLNWKGLSFNTNWNYKVGHYVYVMERRYTDSDGYNVGSNQSRNLLDYWKKPGDHVANPKPIAGNSSGSNAWGTSRYLEKGDFLRLKNISLGYQLPTKYAKVLKLDNIKLSASVDNVYVWHNVSYWDPERDVEGGGYATYPPARTFTVGIKLGF